MKISKSFISLGQSDTLLNISCIDNSKSYYDGRIKKVVVVDVYGNRYNVDEKLCKGKFNYAKAR